MKTYWKILISTKRKRVLEHLPSSKNEDTKEVLHDHSSINGFKENNGIT